MSKRRIGALLTASLLAAASPAGAHPHIWIEAAIDLVHSDGAVRELRIEWAFDDFYSSMVAEDFDRNGNGRLDPAELKELAAVSQDSLRDYGFFTHVRVGDRTMPVGSVKDFRASVEEEIVRYSFTVALAEGLEPGKTPFSVSLYDDSYYTDVSVDGRDAVRLSGDWPAACRPNLVEDRDNPIYFGMVYPIRIHVRCDG